MNINEQDTNQNEESQNQLCYLCDCDTDCYFNSFYFSELVLCFIISTGHLFTGSPNLQQFSKYGLLQTTAN